MTEKTFDTAEKLISDLVGVFKSEQTAEDKLNKAKENEAQAKDKSLRSLASKLSAINEDLDEDTIGHVAESAAQRIAGDNANILKARKSEIKTLLTGRAHLTSTIEEFDSLVEKRREDDPKFSINIRQKTLWALRQIKASPDKKPKDVIKEFEDKLDYVKPEDEKARDLVEKLLDSPALGGFADTDTKKEKFVLDDRALSALETLREVIDDGPDVAGTIERRRKQEREELESEVDKQLEQVADAPDEVSDDWDEDTPDTDVPGPDMSDEELEALDSFEGFEDILGD